MINVVRTRRTLVAEQYSYTHMDKMMDFIGPMKHRIRFDPESRRMHLQLFGEYLVLDEGHYLIRDGDSFEAYDEADFARLFDKLAIDEVKS